MSMSPLFWSFFDSLWRSLAALKQTPKVFGDADTSVTPPTTALSTTASTMPTTPQSTMTTTSSEAASTTMSTMPETTTTVVTVATSSTVSGPSTTTPFYGPNLVPQSLLGPVWDLLSSHVSMVGWLGLHGDQGGPLQVLTQIISLWFFSSGFRLDIVWPICILASCNKLSSRFPFTFCFPSPNLIAIHFRKAFRKPVLSSSFRSATEHAWKAVDGDAESQWASVDSTDQWLWVDLLGLYAVNRVVILFGDYPPQFAAWILNLHWRDRFTRRTDGK